MKKIVREFLPLFEIGEANVKPYDTEFIKKKNSVGASYYIYKFKTEDGDNYAINFMGIAPTRGNPNPNIFVLNFGRYKEESDLLDPRNLDFFEITSKGQMYKIMSTVAKTFKDFEKIKFKKIIISPSKNNKEDIRRYKLYMQYIKKLLPDYYDISLTKDKDDEVIVIQNKN